METAFSDTQTLIPPRPPKPIYPPWRHYNTAYLNKISNPLFPFSFHPRHHRPPSPIPPTRQHPFPYSRPTMRPDTLHPQIAKTSIRAMEIADTLWVVPGTGHGLVIDMVFEHLAISSASQTLTHTCVPTIQKTKRTKRKKEKPTNSSINPLAPPSPGSSSSKLFKIGSSIGAESISNLNTKKSSGFTTRLIISTVLR